MADPVTPQEHILQAAARMQAQRDMARQVAAEIMAERKAAAAAAAAAQPTDGKVT